MERGDSFLRGRNEPTSRKSIPASSNQETKNPMAANPLSKLVQLSQQRSFLYSEHVRMVWERATRKAISTVWKAYAAANEAYIAEGCRVLLKRTIKVHSLPEIEVLIALFESCSQPYRLKSVIVKGSVPVAEEKMGMMVEKMKQRLEEAGFTLVQGNTYAIPKMMEEEEGDYLVEKRDKKRRRVEERRENGE